jgi:SAM-dependent methyltransferase
MTGAHDWQGHVGRAWADEWRRTDRSFAGLTPHLLAAIAEQPGTRVLDIGCGAGEISLGVARARPDARVTGIDISADLVAAASQRAAETGAQRVRFAHADAGLFHDPAGPCDLLVSRHGVMFFADPPRVFGHLARQAAADARMVFSCFRTRAENPWADLFDRLLPAAAPAGVTADEGMYPAGPFAFADPDHRRRCMAGWADLACVPVDFRYVAGSGDDPVAEAVAFFTRIGPAAPRLATLTGAAHAQMLDRMAGVLHAHCHDGVVALPAAAWVVTAQRDR